MTQNGEGGNTWGHTKTSWTLKYREFLVIFGDFNLFFFSTLTFSPVFPHSQVAQSPRFTNWRTFSAVFACCQVSPFAFLLCDQFTENDLALLHFHISQFHVHRLVLIFVVGSVLKMQWEWTENVHIKFSQKKRRVQDLYFQNWVEPEICFHVTPSHCHHKKKNSDERQQSFLMFVVWSNWYLSLGSCLQRRVYKKLKISHFLLQNAFR